MELRNKNASTLLDGIKEIAGKKANTFDFISDLRKYIVWEDTNLVRVSEDSDPEQIAILYVLQAFLSDIWLNLSTDASFEFPWKDPDVKALSENLRNAILVVTNGNKDFEASMKHLSKAIYHYHICLNRLERQLLNEGPKRMEVKT